MMHRFVQRFLTLMASLLFSFAVMAQEDVEITVFQPGTLAEQLLSIFPNARNEVVKLKVNGNIDGNDMMFIRELCGVKDISTPTEGKLTRLDLNDSYIVATDKPYISIDGVDYTTHDDAFGCCFLYNCSQLESLELPHTILAVDSFALANCSSLKTVDLPVNVTSIGYGAFVGCSSIEGLTLPNATTSLENGAFQKMTALRQLDLGDGVTAIDNSMILGDDNLEVINAGRGLQSFHPVVFYTAPSLREVNVSVFNPYWSSDNGVVFSHDKDTLVSFPPAAPIAEYVVADTVRRIGHSAFYGARYLSSVTLPDSLTVVDSLAFFNCMALSNVALGQLTERIAFGAFGVAPDAGPASLTEILIPPSVSEIEGGAFFCNTQLARVVVDAGNPSYVSDANGFVYDKAMTTLCHAPATTGSLQLPATVKAIGDFAVTGACNLPTLYVDDSITDVGTGAFAYSKGLFHFSLGKGLTRLGDMVVQGCKYLNSVRVFADSFDDENVGEYAFYDEEGYVAGQCTLFVKPERVDYFSTKRGFYSEATKTSFFAAIQGMDNADGISQVTDDSFASARFFSPDGRQTQGARRGLNIVRLPEGRSIKRFFK